MEFPKIDLKYLKEAFKESGEVCRNARFKVLWGRR